MTTIFTQNGPRLSFWVKIVVILWICSASSFFLSWRKITWINSQKPKTRGHVEHLSLYKSKHEFDLNIFGKACYFLCSLGLTFSKLAGQIFYIMALQALVLNSDVPENIKALAYLITYLIIIILHNLKESFINLWMAAKNDSGSYLRCEIFGFFLLSFPQNERKIYY